MRLSIPAVALSTLVLVPAAAGAQKAEPLALRLQQRPIAALSCPMPVHVPAQRTAMPVAPPDTTVQAKILVVEPGCHNPLGPRSTKSATVRLPANRSKDATDAFRDALDYWLRLQPRDTSKRPPGR